MYRLGLSTLPTCLYLLDATCNSRTTCHVFVYSTVSTRSLVLLYVV